MKLHKLKREAVSSYFYLKRYVTNPQDCDVVILHIQNAVSLVFVRFVADRYNSIILDYYF